MVYSYLQQLYIMDTLPMSAEEGYYRDLLADIELQGLSPLVYQLLYENGQLESTPLFFRERLQAGRREALFRNLLLKKESSMLYDCLQAAGVETIPLKGTHFAETYLGHLAARYTTDIDILVRPEDVESAVAALHALGYDREDPINPDHFHRVFYKQRTSASLPSMIEIHWNLIKSSSARLNIEQLWLEAQPLHPYTYIKQLSVRHTFYTICLHGTNHNMDSAKHSLDIAHLLFRWGESVHFPDLFEQAKDDHTLKRVQEALALVYEFFPALHEIKPLPYRLKNRSALRNNKNIRRSEDQKKVFQRFLFNWRTADRLKYRLALLRNAILPSPSLALYSLNENNNSTASLMIYMKLYRQRLANLLFPLIKRTGENNNERS